MNELMGHPLAGKRIAVTRSRGRAASLAARLREKRAAVLEVPTIRFEAPADPEPLNAAIARLAEFDWIIFSSSTAVDFFFRHCEPISGGSPRPENTRVAGVGPATCRSLRERGWEPDIAPSQATSAALTTTILSIEDPRGRRFLLPRSHIGRRHLEDTLRRAGAEVTAVEAYRTVAEAPEVARELLDSLDVGTLDAITFTSPSTFMNLASMAGTEVFDRLAGAAIVVASIGPVTTQAIRSSGVAVHVEAERHTAEGLVEALEGYFAQQASEVGVREGNPGPEAGAEDSRDTDGPG